MSDRESETFLIVVVQCWSIFREKRTETTRRQKEYVGPTTQRPEPPFNV